MCCEAALPPCAVSSTGTTVPFGRFYSKVVYSKNISLRPANGWHGSRMMFRNSGGHEEASSARFSAQFLLPLSFRQIVAKCYCSIRHPVDVGHPTCAKLSCPSYLKLPTHVSVQVGLVGLCRSGCSPRSPFADTKNNIAATNDLIWHRCTPFCLLFAR